MSYNNFKANIISAKIQAELEKEATLCQWCNTDFEGEAKRGGTVTVNFAGDPTIRDYTGADITAEEVPSSSAILQITQAKYFNFYIKDIDKAMMTGNLFDKQTERAKLGLALARESLVAGKAADAGHLVSSTAYATSAAALAALSAAGVWLHSNNVPKNAKICADVPWWFYDLVIDKLIDLDTDNSELISSGATKAYKGIALRPTNCLYNDGTDDYIMVRTKEAIAFAAGFEEFEAYRAEKNFSDGLKGLDVCGAKVMFPKQLYTIKAHASA